jgi:hypothetical protein
LAQIAYAIAFVFVFVIDSGFERKYSVWVGFAVFLTVLPFGTLVAFVIYFTTDQESWLAVTMRVVFDFRTDHVLSTDDDDNLITQFVLEKLSKHLGFILEAAVEGTF